MTFVLLWIIYFYRFYLGHVPIISAKLKEGGFLMDVFKSWYVGYYKCVAMVSVVQINACHMHILVDCEKSMHAA